MNQKDGIAKKPIEAIRKPQNRFVWYEWYSCPQDEK